MMSQLIYFWGNNEYQQSGGIQHHVLSDNIDGDSDEDDESILLPTEVYFNGKAPMVKSISCGWNHTLFILRNGSVYSCGLNDFGQLGLSHCNNCNTPERIETIETDEIVSASCGESHSILINSKGFLLAFGRNDHGQLGIGNITENAFLSIPKIISGFPLKTVIKSVACGKSHTLALSSDGKLYAWGNNEYGQIGNGSRNDSVDSPMLNRELYNHPTWKIAAGAYHSFALTISGSAYGWGKNTSGQLGLKDCKDRLSPSYIDSVCQYPIRHICCGEEHSVLLTSNHRVYSFGAGSSGQLGHGDFENIGSPHLVQGLSNIHVTQIACGRKHTLAYSFGTGCLYAFGLGAKGQLGVNSSNKHNLPTCVEGIWKEPSLSVVKEKIELNQNSNDYFKGEFKMIMLEVMKDLVNRNDSSKEDIDIVIKEIYACGLHSCALVCRMTLSEALPQLHSHLMTDTLMVLNEDKCKEIVTGLQNKDPLCIARGHELIDIIFGSSSILNGSFLQRLDCENDDHPQHGLRMTFARKFIETLYSSGEVASGLMLNSVREKLIPYLSVKTVDIETLRVAMLIPMFPFFSDVACRWQILLPFGTYVLSLPPHIMNILADWWSQATPTFISVLVKAFKQCVSSLLDEPIPSRPAAFIFSLQGGLKTCMSMLEKISKVNESAGFILDYQAFYLEDLPNKINMKEDYINWIQNHDVFSFSKYPFALNTQIKSMLLAMDAEIQMKVMVNETHRANIIGLIAGMQPMNPFLVLSIRREHIVDDTLNELLKHQPIEFKKPLKIKFNDEKAEDAGGVKKEFFLVIMKEILNPEYGMFRIENSVAWFNSFTFEGEAMFLLIGIICGLAIYNSIILDLPFPLCLYKKLLNKKTNLDDLREIDPDLARNLQWMLDYTEDDFADVFDMDFIVTETFFDQSRTTDLIDGGGTIKVTKENREAYVDALLNYKLNKSVEMPYGSFAEGFHRVCGKHILDFFQPQELMELVVGLNDYDLDELEKICEYKGEYYRQHPVIINFWDVFHSFTLDTKKRFLAYLTGSTKISIFGIKNMKFVIQPVPGGEHGDHLPVAHTCFNLLDLPRYPSLEIMKTKLTQAIENYQGFGLV